MDTKVLASLITGGAALVGILITAMFACGSYYYKNRQEKKASARRVLYLLLEIRYSFYINEFDSNDEVNAYTEKIKNVAGTQFSDEEIETMRNNAFKPHFKSTKEAIKPNLETEILKYYDDALFELSKDEPVLAYKLRGKRAVEKVYSTTSDQLDTFFSDSKSVFKDVESSEPERVEAVIDAFKQVIRQKALEDLDQDILVLARNCSRKEWRKCKEILRCNLVMDQVDEKDIAELINEGISKYHQPS
ncbi:hypothetical protein [Pseudoalteromonas obscura]|uniref:Uncharacterized protein n=1 Tax=Pseudoalteromonas obscura TaxID=3048491 RepID=A0ABT7EJP1_9GAMM|nr:hypothetical protein [Pseudoalteromonas sp. P94(2023)]MDK2595238.1 hypothetical protein [Pseudoalteromonas sp. P94(2023)]